MDLSQSLLEWANKQQLWQQDLLRRIANGEQLNSEILNDYAGYLEYQSCTKQECWFSFPVVAPSLIPVPIDASDLQKSYPNEPAVSINKIKHLEGANRLAPGVEISFASQGLTIVAGNNGSGKSGYIRILKQVASSRGPESVLENVFAPTLPKAEIIYQIENEESQSLIWQKGSPTGENPLQRVRIFDTKSAFTQLNSDTEVAYVPPVLRMLAEYSKVLKAISEILNERQSRIELQSVSPSELDLEEASNIVSNLGSIECFNAIKALQPLSEEEFAELSEIEARIATLSANDPIKLATQARNRADQLKQIAGDFNKIAQNLGRKHIDNYIANHNQVMRAKNMLHDVAELAKQHSFIPNVGSDRWRRLWLAADEYFSLETQKSFPDTSDDAFCPLCQQVLDENAKVRLRIFQDLMTSEAQSELTHAEQVRVENQQLLNSLPIMEQMKQEIVDFVGTYDNNISKRLEPLMSKAKTLRNWLLSEPLSNEYSIDCDLFYDSIIQLITSLQPFVDKENEEAEKLTNSELVAAEHRELLKRKQELERKRRLYKNKEEFQAYHDKKLRVRCLKSAEKLCGTTGVSRYNTQLSEDYVSRICSVYKEEVKLLGLRNVPIEMIFSRSARATSFIKIALIDAPSTNVASVLSEGEQRIAAIAGFFADLTESKDGSTLVFDDPVSSLDHAYREAVARRLLIESRKRQVIVFTHDFTFVRMIGEQKDALEEDTLIEQGVALPLSVDYVHIARSKYGAGVPTKAENWRRTNVKDQLSCIEQRISQIKPLYDSGEEIAYCNEARDIIGSLRDTWELLVEQDVLNGVVTRYERPVQTQRLGWLTHLTVQDVTIIQRGMSLCSRWLNGHCSPIADRTQIVSISDLREQVDQIRKYQKELNKRKNDSRC